MATLTLYHNDMSVCAAKVRMLLAEKGLAWDGIHLNLRAGDAHKPDYVKLNPNRVVPTLVHDGHPIIESNVICEYVEDVWPERSLRPSEPRNRAQMRLWMKQLDESIHAATGTVSTCIAFRLQHLKRDPDELRAWVAALEPARRERTKAALELGTESPFFAAAVRRLDKLAATMDDALQRGAWLAGDEFSLADLVYASYMDHSDSCARVCLHALECPYYTKYSDHNAEHKDRGSAIDPLLIHFLDSQLRSINF
jgi:glutathione S-transferase